MSQKELLIKVFKKAEMQSGKKSKNGIATYLESYFEENYNYLKNKKSYTRYYDFYINGKTEGKEDLNLESEFLDFLANYISYESYEDFLLKNSSPEEKEEFEEKEKEQNPKVKPEVLGLFYTHFLSKRTLYVLCIILFVTLIFNSAKKESKWMQWNGDHFEEILLDSENYEMETLRPLNENLLEKFKKIEGDCETEYFDKKGEAKIWYGKNAKKELEFFTLYGLHPETGKTLKPITKYMIRNYICEDY
ncbi:hypothetical protein [Aureivirga sp. CE67]|uniref:hypothetical protein n=1 Tax=Aureivirga sp. CE67 TaxID=1788983 RepID=UPI0018C9C91C|nr:hypothetical protein [Aureivirga sp. CE67]